MSNEEIDITDIKLKKENNHYVLVCFGKTVNKDIIVARIKPFVIDIFER